MGPRAGVLNSVGTEEQSGVLCREVVLTSTFLVASDKNKLTNKKTQTGLSQRLNLLPSISEMDRLI